MTGFKSPQMIDQFNQAARVAEWPPADIDLGPESIQARVLAARRLRAATVNAWFRHWIAEWRSVWRRPGRAIPETYRSKSYRASKAGA
jgi:hypothetical protein